MLRFLDQEVEGKTADEPLNRSEGERPFTTLPSFSSTSLSPTSAGSSWKETVQPSTTTQSKPLAIFNLKQLSKPSSGIPLLFPGFIKAEVKHYHQPTAPLIDNNKTGISVKERTASSLSQKISSHTETQAEASDNTPVPSLLSSSVYPCSSAPSSPSSSTTTSSYYLSTSSTSSGSSACSDCSSTPSPSLSASSSSSSLVYPSSVSPSLPLCSLAFDSASSSSSLPTSSSTQTATRFTSSASNYVGDLSQPNRPSLSSETRNTATSDLVVTNTLPSFETLKATQRHVICSRPPEDSVFQKVVNLMPSISCCLFCSVPFVCVCFLAAPVTVFAA